MIVTLHFYRCEAAYQTMVSEPNLVLQLSACVIEMTTHTVKESCLGEFMTDVQVCDMSTYRVRRVNVTKKTYLM